MSRPPWDFEYLVTSPGYGSARAEDDVVVALHGAAAGGAIGAALAEAFGGGRVEPLVERAPIFWYRLRLIAPRSLDEVGTALARAGLGVRFVTSSVRGSLSLGLPLDLKNVRTRDPIDWRAHEHRTHDEPTSAGRWLFHEPGGIDVDRAMTGTGAGTRLAVIDDEARDADALPLDQEVCVGTTNPSRGALHGSLMVAWAVGVSGSEQKGIPPFTGVAPDASARLYLIAKPGREVVNLPRAIVRAVHDGADVIVCAAYVDGITSPLLDDALAFAHQSGRGGRGTAVVLPTGREISSPQGSLHASLTLGLGEPASDPRVLCVAPSGHDGGWFLWTDKRGKLRPFANRGPSVRVAAPGDDMSYPFTKNERLGHAESSGASAIAAGVALLVLGTNPTLHVSELYDVLTRTAIRENVAPKGVLADPADLLPEGRDGDGHDAKCGYGRVSAARACASARDPIAWALIEMGDEDAARAFLDVRCRTPETECYSDAFGRWVARMVRHDPLVAHALRAVVRHVRLLSTEPSRWSSQPIAALARSLALIVARLSQQSVPEEVARELERWRALSIAASRGGAPSEVLETWCSSVGKTVWASRRRVLHSEQSPGNPRIGVLGRSA